MALNGFDGNGNFLRTFPEGGWKGDATAGIKIRADRHDDHDQALANALSNMICKDGQTTVLADIPFNGKKITGLGAPTLPTDAVNKAYADSVNTFTTGASVSGADLNGRITFTSPTGANGLAWTGADLSWLARLATAAGPGTPPVPPATINRLVLNNQADGLGTDVIECREDGWITAGGFLSGQTFQANNPNVILATTGAGGVYLRPNGPSSGAGQAVVDSAGTFTTAVVNAGDCHINIGTLGGCTFASTNISAPGSITAGGQINSNSASTGNSYANNIQLTGQGYKPGGGSWAATSDSRLKDVHGDYSQGLAELLQVNPVRYAYKASPEVEYVGVVAQDIEGVFPETVKQVEGEIDGAAVTDLREFDSSALVFALINAVKELSARIEALEAK